MRLTGQKVQQICDALIDAYPTRDLLRIMVRVELDENLEEIAGGENQSVAIFNLVVWAERNARVDDLITRAHKRAPGNESLKQLAAEWHAQTVPGTQPRIVSPLAGGAEQAGPASIDVFLSYSRRDGNAMRQVQEALRESGLSVWTDEGLEPGTQSWQDAISEAVKQAEALVVLLSPNSSQSMWVKNEIGFAQTLNKRVFPILISGEAATAVPIGLINTQWVDGRQKLNQAIAQELLPSLHRRHVSSETRQVPPPAPQNQTAADSGALPRSLAPKGDGGTQGRMMIIWILGAVLVGAVGLFASERLFSPTQLTVLAPAAMSPPPTQTETTETAAPTTMPTDAVAAIAATATRAAAKSVPPTTSPTETLTPAPTSTPTSAPTATWTRTPVPTATLTREPTATANRTPLPAAGSIRMNAGDGAEYVYVPAGEFKLGSDPQADSWAQADEQPQHTLTLPGFWIMRTEVTNGQYKRCIAKGACTEPNNARWKDPAYVEHPVTDVTWYQANEYAAWAGGRLPTEAEWEKACRGTEAHIWPWGDDPPTVDLANYNANIADTKPVGKYSPQGDSPYGLVDMAGNVSEWTSSQYASYPYDVGDGRENPDGDATRALRGGAWNGNAYHVRCVIRDRNTPEYRYFSLGFRVVSLGSS